MDSGARVALRDNGKRRSADKKVEFETVFEAGSRLAILRINKAVEASLHRYNCAVTNSYGNKEAGINVQQGKAKLFDIKCSQIFIPQQANYPRTNVAR